MAVNLASKVFAFPRTVLKASGGGSIALPFDLTLTNDGDTFIGVFSPGTVNGLIPTNYTGLSDIAKTGAVYIVLNVTLYNGSPSAASFATAGSAPVPTSPTMGVPPTSVIVLTHIVVDGSVLRVLGNGNISLQSVVVFETDKVTTVAPGERNTDVWYNYSLNTSA